MNPSQINLYHLDLKSSTLPLERGGRTLFSGKENPLHWCRGRFACRSLGKTSMGERDHFHFKEPLVISQRSWLIGSFTGKGKKTRRSNRLFNGCRNCGHKHSGELALPKGQERLCNVSHEKVDVAEYLLVPFKGLKEWEQMRKTREHKKTEPPWTLLVNGARLFRFTSTFCSIAKLSHVVRMCCPLFGNQKCLLLLWIFIASLQFFISAVRKGGGGSGVSGERAPPETPPPTANLPHVLQPPPVPVMWPPASLLPTSRRPTGISHSCRHVRPRTVASYVLQTM